MIDMLEYLLMSENIKEVVNGEMTPAELDKMVADLRKKVEELTHVHQLDMAEIVEQRRQIDFLMGG